MVLLYLQFRNNCQGSSSTWLHPKAGGANVVTFKVVCMGRKLLKPIQSNLILSDTQQVSQFFLFFLWVWLYEPVSQLTSNTLCILRLKSALPCSSLTVTDFAYLGARYTRKKKTWQLLMVKFIKFAMKHVVSLVEDSVRFKGGLWVVQLILCIVVHHVPKI